MYAGVVTLEGTVERLENIGPHFRERVLPSLRAQAGVQGAYLLRDRQGGADADPAAGWLQARARPPTATGASSSPATRTVASGIEALPLQRITGDPSPCRFSG